MTVGPFDFVNSINSKSAHIIQSDPSLEKKYNAFLTNRAFSYYPETLFDALIMSSSSILDSRLQFDYYFHEVPRASNRYAKWAKPDKTNEDDVVFIMDLFNYSREKALAVLPILRPQLPLMREKYVKKQPT